MKIKARDVEQCVRDMGVERACIYIFTILIEHIAVMNEQMNELTRTCDKMIDMMGATASGYAAMRQQVERIRRKQGEDDLPDNT